MNVQKNLDWLWRLFFYSPDQPPPGFSRTVVPVIETGLDWPQQPIVVTNDYATIAGTTTTFFQNLSSINPQKHWLVDHWSITGGFVAGDQILIEILDPAGVAATLKFTGVGATIAGDALPIVGSAGSGSGAAFVTNLGAPIPGKVYLPSGWSFRIGHTSAAGGVNFLQRMVVRQVPQYTPIRTL